MTQPWNSCWICGRSNTTDVGIEEASRWCCCCGYVSCRDGGGAVCRYSFLTGTPFFLATVFSPPPSYFSAVTTPSSNRQRVICTNDGMAADNSSLMKVLGRPIELRIESIESKVSVSTSLAVVFIIISQHTEAAANLSLSLGSRNLHWAW